MADDKSKYLPLAQVQRMFSSMPDGYNAYLAAYPGIDQDVSQHVKVDPDTGALMVAPPPDVQEQIRAQAIAKQTELQLRVAQSAQMQPLGSAAAVQGLSRDQMLQMARNKVGNTPQ